MKIEKSLKTPKLLSKSVSFDTKFPLGTKTTDCNMVFELVDESRPKKLANPSQITVDFASFVGTTFAYELFAPVI